MPDIDPRRVADTGLDPSSFSDRVRAAIVGRREPHYEPDAQISSGLTDRELAPDLPYAPHEDYRYPLAYPARSMQTIERFRRAARVTLDATGGGFADLGIVPENQTWIVERLIARASGYSPSSVQDATSAGATQNAPTSATNIATINAGSLPAGVYKVTAIITLTGTAEPQTSNIRLRNGATLLDNGLPSISGQTVTVVFDRVTLDGINNLSLAPVANATAGSIYTAELVAQMVSPTGLGGGGSVVLYAGSPAPAPGGTFAPNDADMFASIPALNNGVGQVDGNAYPMTPGSPVVAQFIGCGAGGQGVVNLMYAIGVWDRSGFYGDFPGD